MVGDVGALELLPGQGEHARDVGRHVAVADHHRALVGEVELQVAVVGVAVVPGHELGRGPAARQLFARDAQLPVGLGADRVDHRVVAVDEVLAGQVDAELDVAEEPELRVDGGLLVDAADGLDVRVVGRHPGADEAPGGGQPVVHVDLSDEVGMLLGREQLTRGIEAGGAGADDGDSQGVFGCPGDAHALTR